MKIGSLFAGMGGFDIAGEYYGWDTAWCVEWDKDCQHWLMQHFPHAAIYGDITTLDFMELERVDVLCGGFPCQPNSQAGKQLGVDDPRWLWPHFTRAIRALRPDGSWLKMFLGSWESTGDERSRKCFETWPKRGMMRGGTVFPLPMSVRIRSESVSSSSPGLWPTPDGQAFNVNDSPDKFLGRQAKMLEKGYNGNGAGMTIGAAASSWSTPTADDANNLTRESGTISSLTRDANRWSTPRAEDGERGKGSNFDGLPEDARSWATPAAQDAKNGSLPASQMDRDTLPGNVMAWGTPATSDANGTREMDGKRSGGLNTQAETWATPTTADSRSSGNRNGPDSKAHQGQSLTDQVRSIAQVTTINSQSAI